MILGKKYVPIIKTGESELRALRELDFDVKNIMLPMFELTRGRKNPKLDEGSIESSLKFLEQNFKEVPFILDLTLDEKLTNTEIKLLFSNNNNYANWVNFCLEHKEKFKCIIPVVQMIEETNYAEYIFKLKNQVKVLCEHFKYIVFRVNNESVAKNVILDINNIIKSDVVHNIQEKIIFVFDFKYINNTTQGVDITQKLIGVLNKIGVKNIVISSTSFPENVSDYMGMNDFVKFKMKEIEFFRNCVQGISNMNITYSDYATVNPVRNDNVVFAKGWIPRIDVPALDYFIYCRRQRRKKEGTYADSYITVAEKVAKSDYFKELSNEYKNCWGIEEIIKASEGIVGGSSPRFWISVRVNIYLNIVDKIINKVYQ